MSTHNDKTANCNMSWCKEYWYLLPI